MSWVCLPNPASLPKWECIVVSLQELTKEDTYYRGLVPECHPSSFRRRFPVIEEATKKSEPLTDITKVVKPLASGTMPPTCDDDITLVAVEQASTSTTDGGGPSTFSKSVPYKQQLESSISWWGTRPLFAQDVSSFQHCAVSTSLQPSRHIGDGDAEVSIAGSASFCTQKCSSNPEGQTIATPASAQQSQVRVA